MTDSIKSITGTITAAGVNTVTIETDEPLPYGSHFTGDRVLVTDAEDSTELLTLAKDQIAATLSTMAALTGRAAQAAKVLGDKA